jgi:hypothetical protein
MINKDYKDENFINDLVDRYKETLDDELRLALVNSFDPHFKKYANLLIGNKPVDVSSKDTIKFLRCFMSAEERATVFSAMLAAKRVIVFLRGLFKDSTTQDIYDEVLCAFLEHLQRYKPMIAKHTPHKKRISFTHFIQINIRWHMVKLVKKRDRDLMNKTCTLEFNDDAYPYIPVEIGTNWSPIDISWVHGTTTGILFSRLSEIDRYMLYLKYEDEEENPLSDYDIARLTGLDRMYVRRKMLKIKDQLRELVKTT